MGRSESTCMLPSLVSLSLNKTQAIDSTLFEFLATREKKGGKKETCNYHSEDRECDDIDNNCAIEGYLMVKHIKVPTSAKFTSEMFGNNITVHTPEGERTMRALLSRESTCLDRLRALNKRHGKYLKEVFDKLCVRGYIQDLDKKGKLVFKKDGNPDMVPFGINLEAFGEDLARFTDWYFVDEWVAEEEEAAPRTTRRSSEVLADIQKRKEPTHHRGNLFVRLYDTLEVKMQDDMPHEGVYKDPYLFIILVCAAGTKGFGSYLMDMAYELSCKLGCSTVALASLPEPEGFYYGKHGFRFANRDGEIIDIKNTPWHEETEKGVKLNQDIKIKDTLDNAIRKRSRDDNDDKDKPTKKRSRQKGLESDEDRQAYKLLNLLRYLTSFVF